jgi:hypothetical protein
VSGSQLRLTGVGVVTIAADQVGDSNHLAAASRTNSFTVSRGVQTIRFEHVGSQILGGAPVKLTATSSAGLPVTFSVLSGPAAVAGDALTFLDPGTVTVRAQNSGTPLWLPAQEDQSFDVSKPSGQTPVLSIQTASDNKIGLQVEAPVGVEVILETATDLSSWSVSQRATGQGAGKPVTFPVAPENGTEARFWRVRLP